MTKISVIGLKPKNEAIIKRHFPKIKFRFVDIDASTQSIPPADYCVLMKKFVNHSWHDKACRQFHREKIFIVTGCISNLVKVINELNGKDNP